jgi:hypothetical protein
MKSKHEWVLYTYDGKEIVVLSKKFKNKKDAEKAREKYPERESRKIGVGREGPD